MPTGKRLKQPKRATELEWLRWFVARADFGPADSDVRAQLKRQFVEQTGKRLPKGWDGEEE